MENLTQVLLIVCPLVFLGGLVDSVAGGGGLITLPAYLLAGLPPHAAAGTNKCANMCGTLLATGRFIKSGHIHLPAAITGGAAALLGAWLGAWLNLVVPEDVLYYIMLAVVPVIAVVILLKRDLGTEDCSGEMPRRRLLRCPGPSDWSSGGTTASSAPGRAPS